MSDPKKDVLFHKRSE